MKENTKILYLLKNKKVMAILAFILVTAVAIAAVAAANRSSGEITYRETTALRGDLVVGISERGSVDVGTVDQLFELDLSALQRAGTEENSGNANNGFGAEAMGGGAPGGNGGGFGMFDQIFNMAGSENKTDTDTIGSLKIEKVCVTVGQQVSAGDTLYLLEEESVKEIEEELQGNVEKAQADLNAVYADQKLSAQTAEYTYESSVAYGNYADTEYNTSIRLLEDAVAEKEKALQKAKELLEAYQQQEEQLNADYEEAVKALENCEWSRDHTDKWENTYHYVMYFQMAGTAQSNVDTLEQKKEQLEQSIEQAGQNVETYTRELSEAKRSLAEGKLTAQQTLSLRQLAAAAAQETYDIASAYLEDSAKEQEETYADAKERWEEYSTHIDGNAVKAKYNGVITEVSLKEGDTINTNDKLLTLYNTDDVSITVDVDEEEMQDIGVGTLANISFTAYPDKIFRAEVTEIGDAQTDGNGNVSYSVTALIQGDVTGLYQGMTGEITFITREIKEVLYVPNRAVSREGTVSYVKVRDENGKVRKQKVTTGFSDGINVEIAEGLSEGDTVLIESKVSES